MRDYLKEFCENANVQLTYTKNRLNILSTNATKNIPVIKAHTIFQNCPQEVAAAILNYYTNSLESENNLKTIYSFIEVHLAQMKCKINPPDEAFKTLLIKKDISLPTSTLTKAKNTSSTNELNILQIDLKNFWGSKSTIDSNTPISASGDEPLELEITVNSFNT